MAHNLAGFRLESADLAIIPAPTVEILLDSSPAVSPLTFDDIITLSCNVSTNQSFQLVGTFLYSWRKSGQLIGQTQQLTVSSSGEYSCEVRIATLDSSVSIQSDSVVLSKTTLSFVGQIAEQVVREGEDLSVTCATIGGAEPQYLWFFGNEEIRNSTNQIVRNNQLTLRA